MASWIRAGMALGIGGLLSVAVIGSTPPPQPVAPRADKVVSLCEPGEAPLATCAIGKRRVSICGKGATAAYRYGRPGRVELAASDLRWASTGYSGGGELQVTARNGAYSYTLFDRIVRTGFGADGLNHPKADSGLIVRRGGKILSARSCTPVQPIDERVRSLLPEGEMVDH